MLPALARYSREPLLDGPTPIQRLVRLERALGLENAAGIFVKRDDLMGLGGGGNKLRKLEFLLGEALATGCDTFITTGARQSNHARLSAAAAARAGLACELVLTDTVAREDEAYRRNGNVLLDDLFGAHVHRLAGGEDALAFAQARAEQLRREGRRAYVVGAGGSSPIGCLGYAACAAEIGAQEQDQGLRFEAIIVPNGSAGTQAGLIAGMKALGDDPTRIRSFTVLAPLHEAAEATRELAARTLALLDGQAKIDASDVAISGNQLGNGYGIPTSGMVEAVRLLARTEAILLDPVYSGKAFAGLVAGVKSGGLGRDKPVLFVLTGGVPGLFAYEPALRSA